MRLPGIYARMDELSTDALRLVADQQALRDLAPLNTRGKYHTRFMKDRYPIAGSQLKLERERELFIGAKKKLLLESAAASRAAQVRSSVSNSSSDHAKAPSMRTSLSLGSGIGRAYRKLDFYSDKMASVLTTEEQSVAQAHAERQIRLIDVQHELGLQQFWTLVHSSHTRCACSASSSLAPHSRECAWLGTNTVMSCSLRSAKSLRGSELTRSET